MQIHLSCMPNCIKMNKIVNEFSLARDTFMPEMHLKQPGFTYSACEPFTKNKEFKNVKKQEIRAMFPKMNSKRPAFNMIWLMEILKIQQKELLLIKF